MLHPTKNKRVISQSCLWINPTYPTNITGISSAYDSWDEPPSIIGEIAAVSPNRTQHTQHIQRGKFKASCQAVSTSQALQAAPKVTTSGDSSRLGGEAEPEKLGSKFVAGSLVHWFTTLQEQFVFCRLSLQEQLVFVG